MPDRPPTRTPPPRPPRGGILLCADDYAMTNGVSRSIVELAESGLVSATSAMTTSTHWPSHATWIARLRDQVAVGLHFNLTLGTPLGRMPRLAPDHRLPALGSLVSAAYRPGGLDADEIAAEFERQLVAFEAEIGLPPDHIDGHQHVHALPVVRTAMLKVLSRRYPASAPRPLLRVSSDAPARIVKRARAVRKALTLTALTSGFARLLDREGFPHNDGFAGVTAFTPDEVGDDFEAACRAPGPRHLVMCHPGFVDAELAKLDPITDRRRAEHDALLRGRFPAPLWRPARTAVGDPIDWNAEWPTSSNDHGDLRNMKPPNPRWEARR